MASEASILILLKKYTIVASLVPIPIALIGKMATKFAIDEIKITFISEISKLISRDKR